MEACFRYMCRVDDAGGMAGTLRLEDFLLLLDLYGTADQDERDRETLAVRGMFDDALNKTLRISGEKPDMIRFFTVPNVETGDFDACVVTQITGGVRYIFTNDCDFMATFVQKNCSLTIWG